jgi:hypothetical protein
VTESFNNSSLFHKSLKEAFESFCNRTVAGVTSAELMANFCNNLLVKVGPALLLHLTPQTSPFCQHARLGCPLVSSWRQAAARSQEIY